MPFSEYPFPFAAASPVGALWIRADFFSAINDPAFPFTADAELVIPCKRDRSGAGVSTLSAAQGGLDNRQTAA